MDVKEKIMELLTEFYGVDPMYHGVDANALADHLIANGVTVQEWISVKDRLPDDERQRVLAACIGDFQIGHPKIDTDRYTNGHWVRYGNDVTHWQHLPQPPKGE